MDVMLVEPRYPGNVGSVARAMKNFGLEGLVLVNPCELGEETKKMAKHAHGIVKEARVFGEVPWERYDYTIGTTAITGKDRETVPLPEADSVPRDGSAVLFGNEGTGLGNDVLDRCDLVVHVPADGGYPTMNLSHAVAVVLYSLQGSGKREDAAERELREELQHTFINILEKVGVENDYALEAFDGVVNRFPPSEAEATALVDVFKDMEKEIE